MKRHKHSLSHYQLSTFDMGQLIPVANVEVLPGDSLRMSTSCLLRVSPLMTPVMHPVVVRLHHWYVPYRILWDGWEDFITGGPDGLGGDAGPFPSSVINVTSNSLGDYFGIPTGVPVDVSMLPFMAYNKIVDEFYRDQDLQPERDPQDQSVAQIAWEKDRFTAARPWTQRGPDVTLPIGATAPIVGDGTFQGFHGQSTDGSYFGGRLTSIGASAEVQWENGPNPGGVGNMNMGWPLGSPIGAQADLSQATSSSVNDVRLAFALQRYQEARAQYGARFTEYLRYLGVRSSDARLQRPEYLGGGRSTISFSEVLRTGNESTQTGGEAPIGEMRGHGMSAMRSRRFIRFFEEHGVVLTLASLRPRSMYMDGLHKSWSRRTKEDYWQKELEQIGQEEILNKELYAAHAEPDGVFGYDNRYSSYRSLPSYVVGDFRNTMNDWHLARSFAAAPALNASFIECVPSKRIHAEQTSNVIWGMFSHSIQARRLVGRKTIGRIF